MSNADCTSLFANSSGGEVAEFGRSLHVDFYDVKDGLCDDLAFCYDLLDVLTDRLNMNKQSEPYVFRSPAGQYPDKAGISGWVPLIESGISIHTLTVRRFISIDVYTCGELDIERTIDFLKHELESDRYDCGFLVRGKTYHA